MTGPQAAPYGSWKSPITSDLIVSETVELGQIVIDGDNIYWTEGRPSEGGRYVIVRRATDGTIASVLPPPFNARTRVHEYGGGAYTVSEGTVFFSNFDDQRLYRLDAKGEPRPLTPDGEFRYADGVIDQRRGLMICVREDHTLSGREAVNTLVSLDVEDLEPARVLVEGNDFYSSPRISPDGTRLAWLTWNHPNLPWDGTELWVGELREDGSIGATTMVAGGGDVSVFQPEWSPDGILYFVSDPTGWWNIHRWRDGQTEIVYAMEAEFGLPQWAFGMTTYGFASENHIICAYNRHGTWYIADLYPNEGRLETVPTPFTDLTWSGIKVTPTHVAFGAGSPTESAAVRRYDLLARQLKVLRRSSDVTVDEGYISRPRAIEFPTENGLTAHGFFYPPRNCDVAGPEDEKPPLVVMSHGGPTGSTSSTLTLMVQYWTSRGFAVLDVNYGGSTGYGTEYRRRLNGQWGIVDVNDCVNGAKYLAERSEVDGDRLIIRGGSAGGYTTLAALTSRKNVFKAGASYYGLSELETFVKDTHKFESRYLETLIGPYPQRRDLYFDRSPINHTDRLSCPIIMFQGLEDKIVPPSQAEVMLDALREKGLPVAYVPFEGEQHGFRRAENIKRALDAELYFYSRVFGFELADPVEPVPIENL